MKVTKLFKMLVLLASFSLTAQTAQEIAKIYCDLDRVPDFNYSLLQLENIEKTENLRRLKSSSMVAVLIMVLKMLLSISRHRPA